MGGLSISAVPENIFSKFSRWSAHYWKEFVAGILVILLISSAITGFSIFQQLRNTHEMNRQRRAMNYLYNRTATAADHLNIIALQIQEQLLALARISAYLLSHNPGLDENGWKKEFRPSITEIGKTEKGMFYSPYYKRLTSLDYGIYTLAPDADRAKALEFLRKTYPVLRKMKNIVLGSQSGYNFDPKDYEKLKLDYLYNGFPVRSVFMGTTDGLKLLYPWRGNYPRAVDPRKRHWFQSVMHTRQPVWGNPYMDFDSISGLSIPCSVPIIDLNEKFRGAVGLDLSVNKLTERILKTGNIGNYVKEKAVINLAGETVFSSKSVFFNRKFDPGKIHANTEFKSPLFRNPEIRKRILGKDKGYGVFIIDLGNRRDIYSYAHLEVWNMYFVVVADYDELVKHVESERNKQ